MIVPYNAVKDISTFSFMKGINKFPPEKKDSSLLDTIVQRTASGYMGGCTTALMQTAISSYRNAGTMCLPSDNLVKSAFKVAFQNRQSIAEVFAKTSFRGAAMGLGWALAGNAYKALISK